MGRAMPLDDHPDVILLRRAATAVQRALRDVDPATYGEHLGMGADGTGTERVDDIAEKAILEVLKDSGVDMNLLSEEAGHVDRGGARVLVADPVDGSTNAIRGIPFYCTSLAVADGDTLSTVEAGLVLNLATGDEYVAAKGVGAKLNGAPIHVPAFDAKDVVVATSFGRFGGKGAMDLAATGSFNVRSMGASALEMSLVAHGAVEMYHFPREVLRVTDIAAAALIVREAGGIVVGSDGADLDMRLDLQNRAALTAATCREALALLGGRPA